MPTPSPLLADLQSVLVSEARIRSRVRRLGAEISKAYADADELTVIAIINGSIFFAADLLRHISIPTRLDCLRVSSYGNDTKPVTTPQILDRIRLDLRGRHVLLIDDILDTGKTIARVVKMVTTLRPASLRTCMLLEKKARRKVAFDADFVGFQIPDDFVVGYGLDFAERYRSLPCIGVLKPELQNPPEWPSAEGRRP